MSVPEFVATTCTNPVCGMRFPCPIDEPRGEACPLCEAPTVKGDAYPLAFVHESARAVGGSTTVGVLDNIRSAMNVGTMLRAADGARVDHMHLCGLTAWIDNPKVIKTALGAERQVASSRHLDSRTCIAELRAGGFEIWAIESTPDSLLLDDVVQAPVSERVALVMGNEVAGVDPLWLDAADRQVHIAMEGTKTSLNVGVAFGIAAYAIRASRRGASALG